jgi:serine/threonine-protein kinase
MKKLNLTKTNIFLISLSITLSILLSFSIYLNLSIEKPIRIEDFTSMTQDQLLAWSKENDIKIETIEEYNDEIEFGKVITQNVIVGERLFAGSSVKVIISKGPNPEVMVNLIDFKGKDIGEIQQFIENNKLLAATIEFEKSTEINSAYFIRTDSQSNSIKRGQSIKFYISTGSKEELTTIIVPDFKEYTRQQLSSWGQSNNIKMNIIDEFNNDVASGKVISQSQAPSSNVYDGSSITIKMSLGAGVVLENLVGKSKTTIDKFINDNGLKVNYTYTYNGTQNKDVGISMSPNASTKVGNGTTVNVTLSLGKISVTDFKGKSLSDLQAWVSEVNKQGANLKVNSSSDYSDTVASGLIILQTPSSGDINPGSSIKVSISKGKAIVVGTYKGTTNTSIQEGLKLSKVEVYSNSPAGTVIEQSPGAGTPVDSGSTVTLTVSIGKPTVSSFAGQSLSSLQNQINTLNAKGAGLSLSSSGEEYNDGITKGNIITNSSGSVSVGSSISYSISKGRSVTVNNFEGTSTQSQQYLKFSITYQFSDSVANGVVISQNPKSGSVVDENTTITLVVSKGKDPASEPAYLPPLGPMVRNETTGFEWTRNYLSNYLSGLGFTNFSINAGSYGLAPGLVDNQTAPGNYPKNQPIVVNVQQ